MLTAKQTISDKIENKEFTLATENNCKQIFIHLELTPPLRGTEEDNDINSVVYGKIAWLVAQKMLVDEWIIFCDQEQEKAFWTLTQKTQEGIINASNELEVKKVIEYLKSFQNMPGKRLGVLIANIHYITRLQELVSQCSHLGVNILSYSCKNVPPVIRTHVNVLFTNAQSVLIRQRIFNRFGVNPVLSQAFENYKSQNLHYLLGFDRREELNILFTFHYCWPKFDVHPPLGLPYSFMGVQNQKRDFLQTSEDNCLNWTDQKE